MTRSIFDPTGPETERSGSTFTPPEAANISQMPPGVIDGDVSNQEVRDAAAAGHVDDRQDVAVDPALTAAAAEATGQDPANDPDAPMASSGSDFGDGLSNPGRDAKA